ncbi:MAG: hypothetical protein GXY58_08060 [Planctomycetaceae bacterium]|nr:hypothetical protein [Planctomycetaceae bacterium]
MRSSTGHSAASIRQRTNGSAPGIWRAARGAWCAVPTALLCLLVVLTGRIAAAAEVDEMLLRGRVTADAHGVSGVLISDGYRVTRTDAAGEYQLPIDGQSGRFVFLTTPRGYWTEDFYCPLDAARAAGRADFVLTPVPHGDRFDIVFITDMHLADEHGVRKFQASLAEINQLQPPAVLLWAQGDICLQDGSGAAYRAGLSAAAMPVRHGAGNHEMLLSEDNPRGEFERHFGPTYYSFDLGPVHCIVLDGNKPIPGEEGWRAVHGAVEGRELAWLEADLAAQPQGTPIIVGVHIPIVTTYPERRQDNPGDAPYWEMTNAQALTELLARYRVRLVLQGHMHENERATVQGVEYVESMSLSGSWWKSGSGLERGVDGTPRGFRIVSVDGDRITHRFRSSCESYVDRDGEFYGLEQPLAPSAATSFVFNCYDAPNGATARARLDEGPWQAMPAHRAVNKELQLVMPHHFRLVADLSRLPAGPHTIEVEVTWPDGQLVRERSPFTLQAPQDE